MSTAEEWVDAARALVDRYDAGVSTPEVEGLLEVAVALLDAATCRDCEDPLRLSVLPDDWHPRFRPIEDVDLLRGSVAYTAGPWGSKVLRVGETLTLDGAEVSVRPDVAP